MAGEDGSRSGLGVDGVALALTPPVRPVGSVDLEDGDPSDLKCTRELIAVAACAFDPCGPRRAMGVGPGEQRESASVRGSEGEGALHATEAVDDRGDVGQLVGVDPQDAANLGPDWHLVPLDCGARERVGAGSDRTLKVLEQGPYWVTTVADDRGVDGRSLGRQINALAGQGRQS